MQAHPLLSELRRTRMSHAKLFLPQFYKEGDARSNGGKLIISAMYLEDIAGSIIEKSFCTGTHSKLMYEYIPNY
jgi:hypothetical protein